jgi:hypothetical protein
MTLSLSLCWWRCDRHYVFSSSLWDVEQSKEKRKDEEIKRGWKGVCGCETVKRGVKGRYDEEGR